ncbi:MAG: hypothetical protein QOG77_1822, partial [Solirubrobacteraceae bacterium]|nr:hypothetical protein [Solirubrobacteraceae bacterium]
MAVTIDTDEVVLHERLDYWSEAQS